MNEAKPIVLPGTTAVAGITSHISGVQNGSVELTKQARNAQGELQCSADSQLYVIQVSFDSFSRLVTLDGDNDFTALPENLPYETYQIQEASGNGSVSLLINNETEMTQGILEIIGDVRNEVTIINIETQAFYRSNAINTVEIVIE